MRHGQAPQGARPSEGTARPALADVLAPTLVTTGVMWEAALPAPCGDPVTITDLTEESIT